MELCKTSVDFKNKGNSRTFKYSNHRSTVYQGFQGLEKALMNFYPIEVPSCSKVFKIHTYMYTGFYYKTYA